MRLHPAWYALAALAVLAFFLGAFTESLPLLCLSLILALAAALFMEVRS